MILSSISCVYWPSYIYFGKIFIQILCSVLNWVIFLLLSYKRSLYISGLYQIYDLQILSPIL